MSIKVYGGRRVRPGGLNEVLRSFEDASLQHAVLVILETMRTISPDLTMRLVQFAFNQDRAMRDGVPFLVYFSRYHVHWRFEYVTQMMREGAQWVSYESKMRLWHIDEYWYCYPMCAFEIQDIDGCELYEYWNNADRPIEVSEDEWNRRREIWGNINNYPMVTYDVFSKGGDNMSIVADGVYDALGEERHRSPSRQDKIVFPLDF